MQKALKKVRNYYIAGVILQGITIELLKNHFNLKTSAVR
jgi:hypothetical protein